MNQPVSKPDHLFVTNPLTGKLINILPLFELMDQGSHAFNGPEDLRLRLQDVHDYVSTHVPTTPGSEVDGPAWADINFTLVAFRKTFERMQEVRG